jgi:hypothetical protein
MYKTTHGTSYNTVIILIGIVFIDVLVLGAYLYQQNSPMDALTSAFIIIPAIIVINLVVALLLYLLKRKQSTRLLLLNTIIAPVVYIQLAKIHYHYYRQTHFTTYYFTYKQHQFEIELEKEYHSYNFSDITKGNVSTVSQYGNYILKNNNIVLLDSARRSVIIENKPIGYPTVIDTIQLRNKRY